MRFVTLTAEDQAEEREDRMPAAIVSSRTENRICHKTPGNFTQEAGNTVPDSPFQHRLDMHGELPTIHGIAGACCGMTAYLTHVNSSYVCKNAGGNCTLIRDTDGSGLSKVLKQLLGTDACYVGFLRVLLGHRSNVIESQKMENFLCEKTLHDIHRDAD